MSTQDKSPAALVEALGERLKQARLNSDHTQAELAALAGVSRKAVVNAEKGQVRLDVFVAILAALGMAEQVDLFLPPQQISPVQLIKLQGQRRQRASGQRKAQAQDEPSW